MSDIPTRVEYILPVYTLPLLSLLLELKHEPLYLIKRKSDEIRESNSVLEIEVNGMGEQKM